MKQVKQVTKKPSKLDALTASVAQDFAHQNSYTIHSRVRILRYEAEELDKSVVAMTGALANIRERRAKVEATLKGLAAVLEKR